MVDIRPPCKKEAHQVTPGCKKIAQRIVFSVKQGSVKHFPFCPGRIDRKLRFYHAILLHMCVDILQHSDIRCSLHYLNVPARNLNVPVH